MISSLTIVETSMKTWISAALRFLFPISHDVKYFAKLPLGLSDDPQTALVFQDNYHCGSEQNAEGGFIPDED